MKKAVLLKINQGKKELWENWCKELATELLIDAKHTLAEEGILQELTLSFPLNGAHYIIGYMDGACLPANMSLEINQRHAKMKLECLTPISAVEVLYDIKSS